MAFITRIDTSTVSGANANTELTCHVFTNSVRARKVWINVRVSGIVGNGDYQIRVTRQINGAGTIYAGVVTTEAVPSGTTTHDFNSISLIVGQAAAGIADVITVYLLGLAGDSVGAVGVTTDVSEEWANIDASGRVDVGAWLGQAVQAAVNGIPRVDLTYILGTLLTESVAGYIAAGFKKLYDVAAPVFTLLSKVQSADNDTRLTAIQTDYARRTGDYNTVAPDNAGIAAIKAKTDNLPSDPADESVLEAAIATRAAPGDEMGLLDDAITLAKVDTGVVVATGSLGQWTITVTVRNASTLVAIPAALVTVKDAADAVTSDQRLTDASGQCAGVYAFSLNNGTYVVHITATGYQASTQTLIVSGANQTPIYDLTPIAIGTPSSASLCRLYGYVYENDGTALEGATVTFKLNGAPQALGEDPGVILASEQGETTTDVNGYWYLDLVQGKNYTIAISAASVSAKITVPSASTKDFSEYL